MKRSRAVRSGTGRKIPSPVDVIETAYDLDADRRRWLHGVATAVMPLLDGGRGAFAYYYDITQPPASWLRDAVLLDAGREQIRHLNKFIARDDGIGPALHGDPEPLAAVIATGRKVGLGDLRAHPAYGEFLKSVGARDFVAFRTIEPAGRGISISAGQLRERQLDRRTQRLWARVAAHVAAARRLREAVARDAAPLEAVLTPSGKVAHAEGRATDATVRELLRAAVLRQEKARGALRRRDPVAAIEMWTALVSGRWSLIDRFERGGRRYVVARCNELDVADPRALAPRERTVIAMAMLGKSLKLIAYELGLAHSTVTAYLATAMRKLGASSRGELVRIARLLRS